MSIRITSTMISKQYKKNANNALNEYNYQSTRSQTKRNFLRASEDVFSATKAFKVRSEMKANADHIENAGHAKDFLDTGETNIKTVNRILQDVKDKITEGINGTKGPEDRAIISTALRNMREGIVSTLNTTFSDQYIFGGSDTSKAPFSVFDGELYYRDVNVNTGVSRNGASTSVGATVINFGASSRSGLNGNNITISKGAPSEVSYDDATKTINVTLTDGSTNEDLQTLLRDAFGGGITGLPGMGMVVASEITVKGSPTALVNFSANDGAGKPVPSGISNKADLKALAEESFFVDIGLGLDFNKDGTVNEQSVFDISIPGLSFLGYGKSSDGVSNNLYTLIGDIADYFESPDYTIEGSDVYSSRIDAGYTSFLSKYTDFGSKTEMLNYTSDFLEDKDLTLTEKQDKIEFIDPLEAYVDLTVAKTAYMAALQIGTNLIQPTILDFMR